MRPGSPYNGAATGEPPSEALYCANHPSVPTYLRCGRCDKPICARCRVATPVGYRCFECARLTSVPTYAVSSEFYTRAILYGFALATVVGLIWAFLPGFDFWAALVLGIGTGEVVSRGANMKRGPGLQAVGLAAVVWGVLISRVALAYFLTLPGLISLIMNLPGNRGAPALSGAISGQFDLLSLIARTDLVGFLFLAMAAGLTYIRLR